jgi:hypothetical protein
MIYCGNNRMNSRQNHAQCPEFSSLLRKLMTMADVPNESLVKYRPEIRKTAVVTDLGSIVTLYLSIPFCTYCQLMHLFNPLYILIYIFIYYNFTAIYLEPLDIFRLINIKIIT